MMRTQKVKSLISVFMVEIICGIHFKYQWSGDRGLA